MKKLIILFNVVAVLFAMYVTPVIAAEGGEGIKTEVVKSAHVNSEVAIDNSIDQNFSVLSSLEITKDQITLSALVENMIVSESEYCTSGEIEQYLRDEGFTGSITCSFVSNDPPVDTWSCVNGSSTITVWAYAFGFGTPPLPMCIPTAWDDGF